MNLAARLLGFLDRNQIAFTGEAHRQIVDMIDDPNFADKFREYQNVTVKHGEIIPLHQYVEPSNEALNSDEPTPLVRNRDTQAMMNQMSAVVTNAFAPDVLVDGRARGQVAQELGDLLSAVAKLGEPTDPTPQKTVEGKSELKPEQ